MENKTPASDRDLYRWVKASERLPEVFPVRMYLRLQGFETACTGGFAELVNGKIECCVYHMTGSKIIHEEDFYKIEWLEKLPPAPVQEDKNPSKLNIPELSKRFDEILAKYTAEDFEIWLKEKGYDKDFVQEDEKQVTVTILDGLINWVNETNRETIPRKEFLNIAKTIANTLTKKH